MRSSRPEHRTEWATCPIVAEPRICRGDQRRARDSARVELEPVPDLQRRRWRPIVIGAAAVAILTGGVFAYTKIAAARARSARTARIERGLASAHRCLFGATPLGAGEDAAAARFRAVYLTTRTTAVSPAWPARCQPVLDALAGDLRDDTAPDRAELARAIGALRIHLAHLSTLDATALQALAGAHASARAEPDADIPAAPPPLAVMTPPATLPLDAVRTVVASPTRRTIWLAGEGARDVCRLGPDGVACFRPDLQLARTVRFGAAADGAPLPLIAAEIDDGGAKRDGVWLTGRDEPVSRVDAFFAFAWSADAIDMLARERGKLVLVRQRGERATRTPIATTDALAILDGEALYWNARGHLRALVLDRDGEAKPATAADLGTVELALPRATCASQHVHALAFGTHVALALDGTWSPPLAIADRPLAITCRERDVVIVTAASIQTCTATSCAPPRPIASPEGDAAHARTGAIDEQPVVLWTGTDSEDRALRLRIAGRDRILFDDSSHGGPDVYPSQVISIPSTALLVLHGMRGHISVLRADATGALTDVMR